MVKQRVNLSKDMMEPQTGPGQTTVLRKGGLKIGEGSSKPSQRFLRAACAGV